MAPHSGVRHVVSLPVRLLPLQRTEQSWTSPGADEGPGSLAVSLSSFPRGSPEGTGKSTIEAISMAPPLLGPMEETTPCFLSFPEPVEGTVLPRALKVLTGGLVSRSPEAPGKSTSAGLEARPGELGSRSGSVQSQL